MIFYDSGIRFSGSHTRGNQRELNGCSFVYTITVKRGSIGQLPVQEIELLIRITSARRYRASGIVL